jgi:hypothetical protein
MGKISSPHMMKSMIALMLWGCKKIFFEAYMLTVCIYPLILSAFSYELRCRGAGFSVRKLNIFSYAMD